METCREGPTNESEFIQKQKFLVTSSMKGVDLGWKKTLFAKPNEAANWLLFTMPCQERLGEDASMALKS